MLCSLLRILINWMLVLEIVRVWHYGNLVLNLKSLHLNVEVFLYIWKNQYIMLEFDTWGYRTFLLMISLPQERSRAGLYPNKLSASCWFYPQCSNSRPFRYFYPFIFEIHSLFRLEPRLGNLIIDLKLDYN